MARPTKDGLAYFPFDVDFDTNEKTEAIMGEFGAKGVLIFIYLLEAIYRKGYFLRWTELTKNQLANRVDGANGELVQRVVDRLVAYGTFNEGLFNSAEVLSSQRIQDTYLDATKRRKNANSGLYWINANNNPPSSGVNADINRQSKVKESKEKKSKAEEAKKMPADDARVTALRFYQENLGIMPPIVQQEVEDWVQDLGSELVCEAIKRAVESGKEWRYAKGILRDWDKKNIRSMSQVEAEDVSHDRQQTQRNGVRPSRREATPDWVNADQPATGDELSPAEEAELAERMAKLKGDA